MASTEEVLEWIRARGVEPLYLTVSGSHLWGLNRPDSDLDIRGIYLDPLNKVLGLHPGRDTIEALNILGPVDIQLYELKKFLGMLGTGTNGNAVSLLLGPTCFYNPGTADWGDLAAKYCTKRLARFFCGYYNSQRKRAATNRGGKSLLYTYQTAMMGCMFLLTGEMIFDFHRLKREFEATYSWRSHMLEYFMDRNEWHVPVSEERLNLFEIEWEGLLKLLREAEELSSLRDSYENYEELNEILLAHRLGPCTL